MDGQDNRNAGPQPDTAAALDALSRCPGLVWVVAIHPGKDDAKTKKVVVWRDGKNLAKSIERAQGQRNFYYHRNVTVDGTPQYGRKALKEEIVAVHELWADVDPAKQPKGTSIEDARAHYDKERPAILARLRSHDPPPTEIVDSGGGYQAFWSLAESVEVKDEAAREEIEARLRHLAKQLGGDIEQAVVNFTARLPGTLNLSTSAKAERGRKWTSVASVVEHHPERIYPLVQFEKAPPKPKSEATGTRDPDERLRPGAPTRQIARPLAKIMREGLAADTKGTYKGDRSLALFAVNCALVRANNSIAEIAAINLDKANKLSEHVYEQGDPPKYARRQAERAFSGVVADIAQAAAGAPATGSEDAFAVSFVDKHKHELRYVAEMGRWSRWNGCKWTADRTVEVFDMVRRHVRSVTSAKSDQKAKVVAAVERLARGDRRIAAVPEDFDADPFLLNTPGGIVDLRTGEIRPCDPLAMCSKCTAVAPAPPGTRAPLWEKFLSEIMAEEFGLTVDPGESILAFLQRFAGYCLTGSIKEEVFGFAYGTGQNGKSKFVNTLRRMMSDYAMQAPVDLFLVTKWERHPTELADLMGKRLVTASEINVGQRWNEARIKAITGGDPIRARFMRQDFFEFDPQFKALIHGNNKPKLGEVDAAIGRRMNLLPFEVTISMAQRDNDLEAKLEAEWPAILRWAIDGCLLWQRDGLQPPERVRAATKDYLDSEDDIGLWKEECTEPKAGAFVSTHDLHHSWFEWANERGVDIGLKQTEFKKLLLKRGLVEGRRNDARGFDGLALKPKAAGTSGRSNGNGKPTEVGAGMPPEPPERKSGYD